MNRVVLVNDIETPLDLSQAAEALEVEPGVFSVLLNGKSFLVRIAAQDGDSSGRFNVDVLGRRYTTEVRDPRNATPRSKAALGSGLQTVTASMPGKVIRVLVTEGQVIDAGQGLIVVEAMKMQNEMKAAKPGRVMQVHAKDGDTVGAGDVLVTIE